MNVRGAISFFTAIIVITCCAAGCTDIQTAVAPPSGLEGGITEITPERPEAKAGLDEALAMLDTWQADHSPSDSATVVHQALGLSVGPDGRARSWVFGVRQGDVPIWLVYDREGMQEFSLSAPLPEEGIVFDAIVMPEDLYDRNRATIEDALRRHGTDVGDLTLTPDEYLLTIRSGAEFETLAFRAATGEVIPSA